MKYSLAPATGFHSMFNCVRTRVNRSAAGGRGGPVQGPSATTTTAGAAEGLAPAALRALTRTEYVPPGTFVTVNDVAVLCVSNAATRLANWSRLASIT